MDGILEVLIPECGDPNIFLPDPELLNYYEQLDNRTIWIDYGIDGSITSVAKKIMMWNIQDDKLVLPKDKRIPIKIMIMSDGGAFFAGLSLIDTIMLSNTPVYTINVSMAASAACEILLAGHKRFAFPHATAMWHSGSCGLQGTMEQVQSATKHFDTLDDQMREYFLSRTNVDSKLYRKYKDKDWYFTAEDALKYGLVDKIITSLDEIN